MPFKTKCPGCGKILDVPDSVVGKRVKCPACAHLWQVPAPTAAAQPAASPAKAAVLGAKCPGCGKGIQVPDSMAGKRVKCPACAHVWQVPRPVVKSTAPDRKATLRTQPASATSGCPDAINDSETKETPKWIWGFAGLAVVFLCGLGIYAVWSSGQTAEQTRPETSRPREEERNKTGINSVDSASSKRSRSVEDSGGAACATCLGGCGTFVAFIIGLAVLHIVLLVWVARDAKARGMDSAVGWVFLVVFVGLIGLIVYLFARPQGNLIQCHLCQNRRLQASARCPHCGNA